MSIARGYVANHKFLDRMGRVTPHVEYSKGERPQLGDGNEVAAWLPVQRYEYEYDFYLTISAGKVVAKDREGRLVPAGLRKWFNKSTVTTVLTYTATDVAQSVVDLTTGALVTAATDYTEDEVTAALRERGLIRADERAMDFISKPIGLASYNYYKAPGTDGYNPATLYEHNFRPQTNPAVTCDYAITVPVLPAVETTETMDGALANGATDLSTNGLGTGGWFGSTAIHGMQRYDSVEAGANVVCYVFEKFPLAHITAESPIIPSVSGLTKQLSSIGAISAAGDYFIDYEAGVLFLYEADGDAIPSPWSTAATITYYQYEDAVAYTSTRNTTYMCATGNLDFGDFLTYDENSNLVQAVLDIGTAEGYSDASSGALYSADPEYDSETSNDVISLQLEQAISNHVLGIVGQIIGVNEYPRGGLEYVRTAYEGQTAANMRTPGTATGGRTDNLTYASAAEKMIIVNLIFR